MLQGISNTIASLPVASIGCTAAGLFIGRKFCTAGIYKAGSIGANLIGSKKGNEWNQASKESFTLAKKNGIRDLTAATGLIAIGLASGRAQEKVVTKEETGYFQDYGMPTLKVFIPGSIGGGIGWMLKRSQVFKALESSKYQVTLDGNTVDRYNRVKFFANI